MSSAPPSCARTDPLWPYTRLVRADDLALPQRVFRHPVAGLHDARLRRRLGGRHSGDAREEAADVHRVGGVVGALVDHLQGVVAADDAGGHLHRSEEHTSELQSLMRISYAVFCLQKKNITQKR